MNVYLSGALWLLVGGVCGAVIGHLVRHFGVSDGRPDNNDSTGQVFTVVGGLHGLLVAFVLLSLIDEMREARNQSYAEANGVVAASWAADSLPEPVKTEVHGLSRSYAEGVIQEEWPQMRQNCEVTGQSWAQLDQMRAVIAQAVTTDDWQLDRKTVAENHILDVYQARQARLATANEDGIGAVVWFVLIIGSVITLVLANLFGGTKPATHIIIVTTLTAVITLLLFAIYELQAPFSGGAAIGPEAFEWALDRLG